MQRLEIDLQLPILPKNHPVIMVRPGKRYHLHQSFLETKAVSPDFPFLKLPDQVNPIQAANLQKQLGRAMAFRDWMNDPVNERGLSPSVDLDLYSLHHEERKKNA